MKCDASWPSKLGLVLILVCAGCLFCLVQAVPCSWAGSKDKPMSEEQIRGGWVAFSKVRNVLGVKGTFPYLAHFEAASRRYHLPLPLLVALAKGESSFDPRAASHKDCLGIMQIQWPGTAGDLGIVKKADLYDPAINIDAGARYFSWLLKRFNQDYFLAVAAYNYGPNAIDPARVPPGAVWYAAYILHHLIQVVEFPEPPEEPETPTMSWRPCTGGTEEMGQVVLIQGFDSLSQAAGFVDYLCRQVEGLTLEIRLSPRSTYHVVLTYETDQDRQQWVEKLIIKTGIRPVG